MAKIVNHPKADDPQAMYPGVADVNRKGVVLAVEMLCELESGETVDRALHVTLAELSELEHWPRHGKPFRNIVHEYLVRARDGGGSDVEAGFCAVLSDVVSQLSEGSCPEAEFYRRLYNI